MIINLKNYISEGDEVKLVVTNTYNHNEQSGQYINQKKRVRKYKVQKVYPYICICMDYKTGDTRVAGIGDLVISHSLLLPNNPLEIVDIEEEK